MGCWEFSWHRGWPVLEDERFLSLWEGIVTQCPNARVFDEPALVRTWFETKGRAMGLEPLFCLAKRSDGMSALMGLTRSARGWKSRIRRQLVGVGEPHFDYQQPVWRAPDGHSFPWGDFWAAIEEFEIRSSRDFESLRMVRMREDTAPPDAVRDHAEVSPYISLKERNDLDQFLATCRSSHRADVRRQRRRLIREGKLTYEVFQRDQMRPAMTEFHRMREAYERLHADEPSVGLFSLPGTCEFYEQMICDLLQTGLIHFSRLLLNGTPISWHFGFLHRNVLHWYKPTYAKEFRNFSPGKVHLAYAIEEGIKQGWTELDLGPGAEDYKFQWTPNYIPLYTREWRSVTLRGTLVKCLKNARRSFARR